MIIESKLDEHIEAAMPNTLTEEQVPIGTICVTFQ